MGKAGKWIRNLLLGKKEKAETSTLSLIPSSPSCSRATPKRRWSFRRSNTNTEKVIAINHKSCRSFDSLITSQALFEYAIQHQKRATVLPYKAAAAATKIQAAFRSYLAWKALCALRSLVKLQALVRGHLVRKRTTTMVRCMSALVAIQVRARFHRIQMADSKSNVGAAGKQEYLLTHRRPLLCEHNENQGRLGSNRHPSRRFSLDSPKSTHEPSTRLHNKSINEVSASSQTSRHQTEPNYMTRTNSSRAKARSNSEPRQRPTKQKREKRRTSSNEGLHYAAKGVRNQGYLNDHDYEFDSGSTCTNGSSYYATLYAYEAST